MGRAGTESAQESIYSTLKCELLAEHTPLAPAPSLRRAIADYLDYCITTSGGIPPAGCCRQRSPRRNGASQLISNSPRDESLRDSTAASQGATRPMRDPPLRPR